MRSQDARINDLISNLQDKNIPLRDGIATLFREEGITIVSILTAIIMTVSTIVLSKVNSIKSAVSPKPSPVPPDPDPELHQHTDHQSVRKTSEYTTTQCEVEDRSELYFNDASLQVFIIPAQLFKYDDTRFQSCKPPPRQRYLFFLFHTPFFLSASYITHNATGPPLLSNKGQKLFYTEQLETHDEVEKHMTSCGLMGDSDWSR